MPRPYLSGDVSPVAAPDSTRITPSECCPITLTQKSGPVYQSRTRRTPDTLDPKLSSSAFRSSYHRQSLVAPLTTCGDEGTRTPGLLRAREALSQLSYIPLSVKEVGLVGLEPTASPLSEERSNRLSYRPLYQSNNIVVVEPNYIVNGLLPKKHINS